jgi:hypothetical protein
MQDNEIDENKEHGFIKLFRSIRQWEWYKEPNTSHLFIHIILSANHVKKNWKGRTINRGQFITSGESLIKETGLSMQKVRTSLKRLKKTGEILTESTNENTLITVVKYEVYQQNDKEPNKQTTNKQQSNNKRVTTTKETKETKEKRDSTLAYDFLKEFYSFRLLQWEGKYKHQLKDFDKFIDDFNDEVEIDEMDKEPDELFNFMVRYAKGFIKQEPHFDKLKRGHRGQNTNGH